MCKLTSFWHRPDNGDVAVLKLEHHDETYKGLNLNKLWREGHYLPDGKIEARVQDEDRLTQEECNERIRKRWPTFISFLKWCWTQPGVLNADGSYGGGLDLSGLTSLAPGCLPKSIGGRLYLDSLTSLVPGCLPKNIGGGIYLNSLSSAEREEVRKKCGK